MIDIHERQSLMIDSPTTDFFQESSVAATRVASCVTSKAATDVAGSLSIRFAFQVNLNAVQLQQESVALILQTTDFN